MAKSPRVDVGGHVYHVLNRANDRQRLFRTKLDYMAFEQVLMEARDRVQMRILAYCVMPNHWHLVLHPRHDGDLAAFMGWLSLTHTQRWRAAHETIGFGHLYQGRYKSFLVQTDRHFLTLCRYVERNPLRAHLVQSAEEWQWSSAWRRSHGSAEQRELLDEWPVPPSRSYLAWVNRPQTAAELEEIRSCVMRSRPFGDVPWVRHVAHQFGIEQRLQPIGRPQKEKD
ncbi:transposase [Candidatus Uhrbacteria bacterium]|nr:transposase [Candidatus Uhrbacteria bacterium]